VCHLYVLCHSIVGTEKILFLSMFSELTLKENSTICYDVESDLILCIVHTHLCFCVLSYLMCEAPNSLLYVVLCFRSRPSWGWRP
jgi:hypothetical protein